YRPARGEVNGPQDDKVFDLMGVKFDSLLKLRNRIRQITGCGILLTQDGVSSRISRVSRKDFVRGCNSLVELPASDEQRCKLQLRFRVSWIQSDGFEELMVGCL